MNENNIIAEFIIKCGDCGYKMAEILLMDDEIQSLYEGKTKFKIKLCPNCGGSSFYTPVYDNHNIVINSLDEKYYLEHNDIIVENEVNIFTLEMKKI